MQKFVLVALLYVATPLAALQFNPCTISLSTAGPTGPGHGHFNALVPWLPIQISNPLQLHIWRQLTATGRATAQSNLELAQRGMLVPGGGLCASTCAVDLMSAIRSYYGLPPPAYSTADELQYIINYVWLRFGHDARMGLPFLQLADVMNNLIQAAGLGGRVYVESLTLDSRLTQVTQLFPYFSNSVPIIGVKGFAFHGSQIMYHAMMATAFNPSTSELTLLDPMNPWYPIHAVVYGFPGAWALKINHPGYALPYYSINDILNIRSLQ